MVEYVTYTTASEAIVFGGELTNNKSFSIQGVQNEIMMIKEKPFIDEVHLFCLTEGEWSGCLGIAGFVLESLNEIQDRLIG